MKLYLILFKVTLLTNKHQLNYENFHMRWHVVSGNGGVEECGVKVNVFRKKNVCKK